uniref:ARAD1D10032p n=1 Tax=Blastobotrys adeninivorans TaxID=409370 RepID=A0A060T997_BLAAD
MEPQTKKVKTEMKIGTHSGTFHADESLAVYMLKLLPRFLNATVLRSRDPELLETCDIIVDVSGQYDGTKHFDHHQRGFEETFGPEYKTKLSSAGLIYKHFGREVLSELLKVPSNDKSLDVLFPKVYTEFVEAIDANDNGISAYPESVQSAYKNSAITLPAMVSRLNPLWNDPRVNDDSYLDERFEKASQLMGTAFEFVVEGYGKGWYPAKSIVREAIDQRKQYDDQGRIVVFDKFVPWKEHLYTIEEEDGIQGQILYVVYSDGKAYRVQAVPESSGSFNSRKALPEKWRGVRDEELSKLSGIPDCIFVHAAGFIGGNKTREGALEMAKKALEL